MSIQGLSNQNPTKVIKAYEDAEPKQGVTFAQVFKDVTGEAAKAHAEAEKSVADFVGGEKGSVHETMIALDKADMKLRLLVQVKNRLLEGYRELMRMQG